jgi:hypothetical protein
MVQSGIKETPIAVANNFTNSSRVRYNNRKSHGHGLDCNNPKRLPGCGMTKHVARTKDCRDIATCSQKLDLGADTEGGCQHF